MSHRVNIRVFPYRLISISLVTYEVKHHFLYCWPFMFPLPTSIHVFCLSLIVCWTFKNRYSEYLYFHNYKFCIDLSTGNLSFHFPHAVFAYQKFSILMWSTHKIFMVTIFFLIYIKLLWLTWLPWWLRWKRICLQSGEPGSIPESGRSPGEGNGYPLQYFCLENPMDRQAWGATVHGVPKSLTWLSNSYFLKRNSLLSKVHRGFLYSVVKIFKFCLLHLVQPFIWHLFLCVGWKKEPISFCTHK